MSLLDGRLKEQLEILAGIRVHGRKEQAAVRYADLKAILQYPPDMQSQKVAAAPTMEEHNALVKDVHAISAVLTQISKTISQKQDNQ